MWLVLGVLLLKAAAPIGLTGYVGGESGSGISFASAFGERIVLCTPNGLKVLRFDDKGNPLPDRTSDDGTCVLCLSLSKGNACAPDLREYLLQARFLTGRLPRPEDSEVFVPAVRFKAAYPRAPPGLA